MRRASALGVRRTRTRTAWRWAGGGTRYLDASALTYGFDGAPLSLIGTRAAMLVAIAAMAVRLL